MKRLQIVAVLMLGCQGLPTTSAKAVVTGGIEEFRIAAAHVSLIRPDLPDSLEKPDGAGSVSSEQPAAGVPEKPESKPVGTIHVDEAPHCSACIRCKRETSNYRGLSFVFRAAPEGTTCPRLTWKIGRQTYQQTGWTNLRNFVATYNETVRRWKPSKPARIASGGPLLFRGQASCDWPGDLRHHLTEWPHGLPREIVDAWDDRRAIEYHTRWHEQHQEHTRGGRRNL